MTGTPQNSHNFDDVCLLLDDLAGVIKDVCEANLAAQCITGVDCDLARVKTLEPPFVLDGGLDNRGAVGEMP